MLDRFRKAYRELSEDEKAAIEAAKVAAEAMDAQIEASLANPAADKRALALARTKLEEAVMWFTKGVTG